MTISQTVAPNPSSTYMPDCVCGLASTGQLNLTCEAMSSGPWGFPRGQKFESREVAATLIAVVLGYCCGPEAKYHCWRMSRIPYDVLGVGTWEMKALQMPFYYSDKSSYICSESLRKKSGPQPTNEGKIFCANLI